MLLIGVIALGVLLVADAPTVVVRDVGLTIVSDTPAAGSDTAYRLPDGQTVYGPPEADLVSRGAVVRLHIDTPPDAGGSWEQWIAGWLPDAVRAALVGNTPVNAITLAMRNSDTSAIVSLTTRASGRKLLVSVADYPVAAAVVRGTIGANAVIQLGGPEEAEAVFDHLRSPPTTPPDRGRSVAE